MMTEDFAFAFMELAERLPLSAECAYSSLHVILATSSQSSITRDWPQVAVMDNYKKRPDAGLVGCKPRASDKVPCAKHLLLKGHRDLYDARGLEVSRLYAIPERPKIPSSIIKSVL